MDQKTVFISYRRALSKHLARSIYLDLRYHDWDAFLDVNTIDSGDFDRIILNQIGARAHFILLISPDALARCANPGDWVLREIEEAVRLERNIVPIIEEGADFNREMGYLPANLRTIISKKSALPLPHFFFDAAVEMLRTRFLKAPEYITIKPAPPEDHAEVQRRISTIDNSLRPAPKRPTSREVMPAPFDWIPIPAGKVKLKAGDYLKSATPFDVSAFSIAKYPVTNAQFAKFIEAGGYSERRWWTDVGWETRDSENWTQPGYWADGMWNQPQHPVVGVTWYEAIAFCQWLSEVTGEAISLPTEQQWQRAAQGDDGRDYPWGKQWEASRCNNRLDGKGAGQTTPVRQYEGKGDSPFGVVDMAGNVWEWCLTAYETGSNVLNGTDVRVLRGGSWANDNGVNLRADCRYGYTPLGRGNFGGFRLARS